MPKGKHIKWDAEWIKNNFKPGLTWKEFAEQYDAAHGTETKPRTMEDKCHRLGITHWNCRDYTDEEVVFIKEYWPVKGSIWCAENIESVSGNKRSDMAIRNKARDLNLRASDELWAKNIEANANLARKPVGTIKMDSGSNVPMIKTENGWKTLASVVYGEPKKGNMLCFLDGDKTNCVKENIIELSRSETAYMTHNRFWSRHPEITKTGVVCVKLIEAQKKTTLEAATSGVAEGQKP